MPIRLSALGSLAVILVAVCSAWSAPPDAKVKLSDVASAEDLTGEIEAKVSEIESGLVTPETFQAATAKVRLAAVQVAVLSQALAEHDQDSKLKSSAPVLRDAAMQLGNVASFDEARRGLDRLHEALEGKGPPTAQVGFDWTKLARTRPLMESLRERTDQIRKALRRPKDPVVESRHATTMAVLALAIRAHADDVKHETDRPMWQDWSMEFQREMTKTASALRGQDTTAALQHFTAAQAACDKCHDKFKR